jgi:hypothetical protein
MFTVSEPFILENLILLMTCLFIKKSVHDEDQVMKGYSIFLVDHSIILSEIIWYYPNSQARLSLIHRVEVNPWGALF